MAAMEMSNMTALGNSNATPAFVITDNSTQFLWENNTSNTGSEETFSQLMNTSMANITEASRGPLPASILQYKIAHWLWLYFSPVLIFGGGLSNFFAIVVLCNRRFRGTGTTFLLTALAVADLTVLMTGLLRQWIHRLTDYDTDIRELTDAGCRIHLFITYFSRHWSAWTLVLVTAERVMAVWMPFKAKVICSRKRIIIAWLLASMVLAAVSSPMLAKTKLDVYRYQRTDNTTYIVKICHATSIYYHKTVVYWSDFALVNAGPSFFIFVFNISIAVKLKRPQVDRQNGKKANKAITSVTIMLFVVSLISLVTTTPIVIFFLGRDLFFEDASTDVYVYADLQLTYTVCNLVHYINNSINFLLYFLCGGRFRKAFSDMFCGRCIKERPHTSVSKTNSNMVDDTTRMSTTTRSSEASTYI